MDIRPIALILGLLAWTASPAQAYRWVDSEGVVHYSDRPTPGAESFELPKYRPPTGTRVARRGARAGAAEEREEPDEEPVRYESLSIVSPAAEETLWNIGGVLSVSLDLTPALRPGHRLRVYIDGQPRIVEGQSFQLEEVHRGVHNLQAEVLDAAGNLMIRSRPNRFYVQQTTLLRRTR